MRKSRPLTRLKQLIDDSQIRLGCQQILDLASLVAGGLLREAPGARGNRCYTIATAPGGGMTNIICTDCEQVVPLADECLPLREGFLAKQLGFIPSRMNLRIEASCEELRQNGSCQRRKKRG